MPRFGQDNETHAIVGSGFSFSGARIESLGATEYTLASIVVDTTGSTDGFADELRKMLETSVLACKKSPRSDNLLVRVTEFNSSAGVREIHGFETLSSIDPTTRYQTPRPNGLTNLYDAAYEGVGAMLTYADTLMKNDFLVNGIVIIITDGADNDSRLTPAMIRQQVNEARKGEKIESLLVILVGINASQYRSYLQSFQTEAGIDQFIDAGDATPGKIAKLAAFVSQSVSSQSQSLGTGGPSQNISATI